MLHYTKWKNAKILPNIFCLALLMYILPLFLVLTVNWLSKNHKFDYTIIYCSNVSPKRTILIYIFFVHQITHTLLKKNCSKCWIWEIGYQKIHRVKNPIRNVTTCQNLWWSNCCVLSWPWNLFPLFYFEVYYKTM